MSFGDQSGGGGAGNLILGARGVGIGVELGFLIAGHGDKRPRENDRIASTVGGIDFAMTYMLKNFGFMQAEVAIGGGWYTMGDSGGGFRLGPTLTFMLSPRLDLTVDAMIRMMRLKGGPEGNEKEYSQAFLQLNLGLRYVIF